MEKIRNHFQSTKKNDDNDDWEILFQFFLSFWTFFFHNTHSVCLFRLFFFLLPDKVKIMISSITSYTNERKSNLLLGFINIFFQKNVYKVIIEIKVKEKKEIFIKIDWKNDDDNDDDWKLPNHSSISGPKSTNNDSLIFFVSINRYLI